MNDRTLHGVGVGVGRNAELGRSFEEDAARDFRSTENRKTENRKTENQNTENTKDRRVGHRRFEDGAEVTRVTEEFWYTEDTLRRMELELKKTGAFSQTEKATDFRFTETECGDATPRQRDVAMEMEMESRDGQCGQVSSTSQVRSGEARRDAKGRSAARPKKEAKKVKWWTCHSSSPDRILKNRVFLYYQLLSRGKSRKVRNRVLKGLQVGCYLPPPPLYGSGLSKLGHSDGGKRNSSCGRNFSFDFHKKPKMFVGESPQSWVDKPESAAVGRREEFGRTSRSRGI